MKMADRDETLDNNVITEQEQETAQQVLSEFKKKNYTAALQLINKLEHRNQDFKVIHNKALIEYCKSEYKKTDTFQKNLSNICKQFHITKENLDDVDQCIIHYNQAILYYHQKQYTQALQIMDRVYKFIEPMDENLAKQVSLFHIELQLCLSQPEKALNLMNYLENQLINGTPSIKLLGGKTEKEKEKKAPPTLNPAIIEFKQTLLMYKVRCYIMTHNLETAKKEIQVFTKDLSNVNAQFLLANMEYLKGNFLEAQKILSAIPKDCLIYNECGESSNVLFYNNVAILHHAMGKPNLACHYFQTALKEDMAVTSNLKRDETPLYTLGGSKYHQLMYNLGISLLYAKKPTQAFDCLIIAVRRYHRNSRLWMRLAECCIMINKKSNEIDFDIQSKQKELVVNVLKGKDKQRVILTTNLSKDKKYNCESESYAVPVPSLEFASLCLRNAFGLLRTEPIITPMSMFLIPGVTTPVSTQSFVPAPSNPLSADSLINLRNSILVASAYVSLCLGDYIIALEHSRELLNQARLSDVHRFLAHLYAAEALILLDKIPEALEHLNPENVKSLNFELSPGSEDEKEQNKIKTTPPITWYPSNISSAHATMHYNIAVAKTIRGQLDEAITLLKQVWQMNAKCKVPAHIVMLVVYIELKLGHPEPAKNLIKQNLYQIKPI